MSQKAPVSVAHADGIGPEIMEASLHIISEAEAQIGIETIEAGEKVYLSGNAAGMEPRARESLRRIKVLCKAPIATPQGGGYKRRHVTTRKRLGLDANARPCVAYEPYVDTKHRGMDVGIVREKVVGVDLCPGEALNQIQHEGMGWKTIDSRGTIVWPGGMSETFVIDSYWCHFGADGRAVSHADIAALYQYVTTAGYDIAKTERLCTFDGKPGFTLAQVQ